MVRSLTVSFDKETYEALENQAKVTGTSRNMLVRGVCKERFCDHQHNEDPGLRNLVREVLNESRQ